MIDKISIREAVLHFFRPDIVTGNIYEKWNKATGSVSVIGIWDGACSVIQSKNTIEWRLTKILHSLQRVVSENPHWNFKFILSTSDYSNGCLGISSGGTTIPVPWPSRYADPDVFTDPVPFGEKINKICFFGSPNRQRVDFCNFSSGKDDITAAVTKGKGWTRDDLLTPFIDQSVTLAEQLEYKYVLNIDGNVTSWDRFVWQLASNSVCLYLTPSSPTQEWYYPILKKAATPFLWVTTDNIIEIKKSLDGNPGFSEFIAENGRRFVRNYLNAESRDYYIKLLFDLIHCAVSE